MNFDKSYLVKKHFAETAMNMILANGVESISVRKVAREAGYAFATIYNHFKNLDELLWLTRDLLIEDIAKQLDYGTSNKLFDRKELLNSFLQYANYYIKHRNAFSFLYFYKLDIQFKYNKNIVEENDFSEHQMKKLNELSESEKISIERAANLFKTINYSIHGLLTLCFSENDQIKSEDIENEIIGIVNSLF